ncbi:MAG TPA: hypothetical protein VMH22_02255 [bacterium]|nr:hypothetical protein [bacterium]
MCRRVIVPVLFGLLAKLALATPATSSRPGSANPPYPGARMVGPASPVETLSEVRALRVEQRAAQARGDEVAARALENQVQRYYLDRTPAQSPVGHPVPLSPSRLESYPLVPDVVIYPGEVMGSGADYDDDGTMWTVCSPLDSTVRIYKSTDAGQTWTLFNAFGWTPACQFGRVQVVVGVGDSNFVHVFALLPFQDGDLVDVIYLHDGTYSGWSPVKADSATVSDFAVCRDNAGAYYLHACATNTAYGGARTVKVLRSTDHGRTWAQTQTWDDGSNPCLSAGTGGSVYYASTYNTWYKGQVALLYNRSYGSGGWTEKDLKPDTFAVAGAVVAQAFTNPDSEAVLWMAWQHQTESLPEVTACYSTDGGKTFSTPAPTGPMAITSELWPDLKNYRSWGSTTVKVSYFCLDTFGYRWVSQQSADAGDPGNWSGPVRIDYGEAQVDQSLRPWLVYSPHGPGGNEAGCVFEHFLIKAFCWNSPWTIPAVEEPVAGESARFGFAPTVVRGVLRPGDRGQETGDRMAPSDGGRCGQLLDATGRMVMELHPGVNDVSRLSPGVYFVREAQAQAQAQAVRKVIITR